MEELSCNWGHFRLAEFKFGNLAGVGGGGAELSPLSTYLEGTAEESSGVIP